MNTMWKVDILIKVLWPLRSPMPGWSVLMQMVCTGNNPGLSNITFLSMIDLNPSDMPCVYSTLKFVSKEASHHNRTPVTTFDQPLYWKALIISCDEECKNIIVRLGGFLYGNELFRKHKSTYVRDGSERVIRVNKCT